MTASIPVDSRKMLMCSRQQPEFEYTQRVACAANLDARYTYQYPIFGIGGKRTASNQPLPSYIGPNCSREQPLLAVSRDEQRASLFNFTDFTVAADTDHCRTAGLSSHVDSGSRQLRSFTSGVNRSPVVASYNASNGICICTSDSMFNLQPTTSDRGAVQWQLTTRQEDPHTRCQLSTRSGIVSGCNTTRRQMQELSTSADRRCDDRLLFCPFKCDVDPLSGRMTGSTAASSSTTNDATSFQIPLDAAHHAFEFQTYPSAISQTSQGIDLTPRSTSAQQQTAAKCNAKSSKSPPLFGTRTVAVLTSWYESHREHPYPAADEAAQLATDAGISVTQLRRWFANRRLRNANTKHIREIVQRRRQQQIQ